MKTEFELVLKEKIEGLAIILWDLEAQKILAKDGGNLKEELKVNSLIRLTRKEYQSIKAALAAYRKNMRGGK